MFNPFRRGGPNLREESTHEQGAGRTPYEDDINRDIPQQTPREGERPKLVIGPAGEGAGEKKA